MWGELCKGRPARISAENVHIQSKLNGKHGENEKCHFLHIL